MYRNKRTAGDAGTGDGDYIMMEHTTADDLVNLLPEFFKKIQEYPEIMKAWTKALNEAATVSDQIWNNFYVQTCDSDTLSFYEAVLGITPGQSDDIEVRRARVLGRLSLTIPYSERRIREILDQTFGDYTLTVDYANLEADMELHEFMENGMLLFIQMWYGFAPAHIVITVHEAIQKDIEGTLYGGGVMNRTVFINI